MMMKVIIRIKRQTLFWVKRNQCRESIDNILVQLTSLKALKRRLLIAGGSFPDHLLVHRYNWWYITKKIHNSAFCKKYGRADMYNEIDKTDEESRKTLIDMIGDEI